MSSEEHPDCTCNPTIESQNSVTDPTLYTSPCPNFTQHSKASTTNSTATTIVQAKTRTAASRFHQISDTPLFAWLLPSRSELSIGGAGGEVRSQAGGSSFVCEEEEDELGERVLGCGRRVDEVVDGGVLGREVGLYIVGGRGEVGVGGSEALVGVGIMQVVAGVAECR